MIRVLGEVRGGKKLDSILTNVKLHVGVAESDTSFDVAIIDDINSTFTILEQLGVGMPGYKITDKTNVWSEFLPAGKQLELVKTYMYMKVKLMFDPPANSTILESYQRQINEYEWRLNVRCDPVDEEENQNG